METIEPTPYQAHVLAIPEDYDLFLGGGRGGGKTYALLLLILRHVELYGADARVLVVRKNFPDLRDFEAEARALFAAAYGKKASYNAQDHLFRFPNNATVQLDQLESAASFQKYQGKSFSLIAVDEAGQFADPETIDLLRSSLRSKQGVPVRMVLSANPGGPGHAWLHRRHVREVEPWKPYHVEESGKWFVSAPSTYRDNPHLPDDYAQELRAATATDRDLQQAWLEGDWDIARGAFFATVYDPSRNVISDWGGLPESPYGPMDDGDEAQRMQRRRAAKERQRELGSRAPWELFVSGDHGTTAPAVFYLCARSRGAYGADGAFFPEGSLVLVDEVAFRAYGTLNQGLNMTVPDMAQRVIEVCNDWGFPKRGILDDATFSRHGSSEGTLADEYRKAGLHLEPAEKGSRVGGWEVMRRLLNNAGSDRPGLYISERCDYLLETLPYANRDPKRPEDVDTTGPDHGLDAARMACTKQPRTITHQKLTGF